MKLLIVDDENQIRKGLKMGIPWDQYGIRDVKTASNGKAALEIIRQDDTDILLTDIKMSGMDGIELTQKAIELKKDIRIIILSGFSEFEYAKKAISFGVKEYLLKPVKILELTTLVQNIVREIKQERQEKDRALRQEREHVLVQQLLSEKPDQELLLQMLKSFGIKEEKLYCVLFEADSCVEYRIHQCQEDALRIVEKLADGQCECVFQIQRQVCWIRRMGVGYSRRELTKKLEMALQEYSKSPDWKGMTMSAVISEIYPAADLPKAYKESRALFSCRLYLGTAQVILQEKDKQQKNHAFYIENTNQLRQDIINFDFEKVQTYIDTYFRNMRESQVSSYDLVKGVCLNFKQILFYSLREIGVDVNSVLQESGKMLFDVPDYITLDEYKEWIINLFDVLLHGLQMRKKHNISNTVRKAVAYIQTHYQEHSCKKK